jgi:erythromycin esterase
MRERMQFWTWYTAEYRELIEWMREENAGRTADTRLLYVGVDCQVGTWYPDLIVDYVEATRPDLAADAERWLEPLRIPRGTQAAVYAAMTGSEYEDIRAGLDALLALFDAHQASFVAGSDAATYRLHRRLAHNLRSIHQVAYSWNDGQHVEPVDLRARCMADNVLWVQELVGAPVKSVLWAHNMHVGLDETTDGTHMTGGYLRDAIGHGYRAVGLSFTRGTLTAVGTEGLATHRHDGAPMAGSVNELLHAAAPDTFALDLTTLPPASELAVWLGAWRPFLWIGSLYRPDTPKYFDHRLGRLFDVLIHVDETTHSQYLLGP